MISIANTYSDIINKRKRDWNCDALMEGALSKKGKKLPFSSPLLNYSTYGGIPRDQITEFFGDPGGGKAQPLYSQVLTPHGFVTMGEIKEGDLVYDGSGQICKVDGVFPQGVRRVYEVRTSMNNYFHIADNHLNSVWYLDPDTGDKVDCVVETPLLIDMLSNQERLGGHVYIDTPSLEFGDIDLEYGLDPYVAGFLFANGSVYDDEVYLRMGEDADIGMINERIRPLAFKYEVGCWKLDGDRTSDEYAAIYNVLQDPYIPEEYIYTSKERRKAFIEGAIKASGITTSTGNPVVMLTDPLKSSDFGFLVRSLGVVDDESYFALSIDREAYIITYEHELQWVLDSSSVTGYARYIESIEEVNSVECKCIHVDSPLHTYITDDFIPTHNTTTAVDICKKAYEIFTEEYNEELYELREKASRGNKQAMLDIEEFEDRGAKRILYVDLEHSFDADWAEKLGIIPGTIDIMQPPDIVAEELLQTVQDLIETGELGLVVLDSIPSLTTRQELEKKLGERTVASLAGLLTVFFRKVVPLLSRYGCTLLIINQVRDNMDNPYVINTPGGKALKFYCSLRMLFRIGAPVDFMGNELPSSAENPAGYIVTAKIVKQKSAPWDRRNGSYYLMAQSGIRVDMDFAKLAVTKYGIIKKAGAWFTMCDPTTGEILEDEDGKPIKVNGMVKVFDYLQTHPEYYQKIQDYILADIAGEDISLEGEEVDEQI